MAVELGGRRSGRTAKQLFEAPQGATYIVPKGAVDYTRNLAAHLGRTDIKVAGPALLEAPDRLFGGYDELAFDHALPDCLSREQRKGLIAVMEWMRSRPAHKPSRRE